MGNDYTDYRHVWLYSKHWYKRSDDVFSDLAIILAERAGMDASYFKPGIIVEILADIAWPHMRQHEFQAFVKHLLDGGSFGHQSSDNVPTLLADKLLSILSLTTAFHADQVVLNLGKPDFTILPEPEKK